MYLGNYTLGQEAVVLLHCTDAAPLGTAPNRAPTIKVFSAAGTQVLSALMPGADRIRTTGLFLYLLSLDARFAAGRYLVVFSYCLGAACFARTSHFDIVAGGDVAGAVISQYHLERPQATHLVQKTDGGKRYFRRNPHL